MEGDVAGQVDGDGIGVEEGDEDGGGAVVEQGDEGEMGVLEGQGDDEVGVVGLGKGKEDALVWEDSSHLIGRLELSGLPSESPLQNQCRTWGGG